MCEDTSAKFDCHEMPFIRQFLHGIPLVFGECDVELPFPPGPHVTKWDGDQATVQIPVPGFGKDEIDLEIKGRALKVTGHKKGAEVPKEEPAPESSEKEGPSGCCEGPAHGFSRFPFALLDYWAQDHFSFYVPIPRGADVDGEVKARVEKGILHVTFQKKPEKKLPVE